MSVLRIHEFYCGECDVWLNCFCWNFDELSYCCWNFDELSDNLVD